MTANLATDQTTGTITYVGAPIHDGSPQADIRDALAAARTHSVPAVRAILVERLTARLQPVSLVKPYTSPAMAEGSIVNLPNDDRNLFVCSTASDGHGSVLLRVVGPYGVRFTTCQPATAHLRIVR